MKKLLLATLIAVASHAALADSTVVMKVKGKMNNASCTPELSNGGSIDFGTIAPINFLLPRRIRWVKRTCR